MCCQYFSKLDQSGHTVYDLAFDIKIGLIAFDVCSCYTFLNRQLTADFYFILVFSIQFTVNKYSLYFVNVCIRTADLWCQK